MKSITLHIKNMVCPRCIMVVREELQRIGAEVLAVELGYATVSEASLPDQRHLQDALEKVGFELIRDKEEVLIEEVKVQIMTYLEELQQGRKVVPLSAYLSKKLGKNYVYLSNRFSTHEARTIEKYLVLQKIERVKELLDYDELTLSEIAVRLRYSSVHYLSAQFKKVVGMSVSQYKANKSSGRNSLDDV